MIKRLRNITGGVPIGAKLGAGNYLEKDLEILVDAGIDRLYFPRAILETV